MRQLSGGDIEAKLARIDKSGRGRKWRKKARARLLADQKAVDCYGKYFGFYHRGAVCTKRRHTTLEAAQRELAEAKAKAAIGMTRRREGRIYECPKCKGYHLTSQEAVSDGYREEDYAPSEPQKAGNPSPGQGYDLEPGT